jgi:hypothetical protein
MAVAAATDMPREFRGVVTIGAQRARELRKGPIPVRVADLVGCSGDFHVGDWLYVTSRGHDGGQSVLATGTAAIDFDELPLLDPHASVVSEPELLWRAAGSGS